MKALVLIISSTLNPLPVDVTQTEYEDCLERHLALPREKTDNQWHGIFKFCEESTDKDGIMQPFVLPEPVIIKDDDTLGYYSVDVHYEEL